MLVFWAIEAVICLISLVTLVTAIVALWVVMNSRISTQRVGKRFCGRCGEPLNETPTSAIALTDKAYFVYACKDCKTETLLPKDP